MYKINTKWELFEIPILIIHASIFEKGTFVKKYLYIIRNNNQRKII